MLTDWLPPEYSCWPASARSSVAISQPSSTDPVGGDASAARSWPVHRIFQLRSAAPVAEGQHAEPARDRRRRHARAWRASPTRLEGRVAPTVRQFVGWVYPRGRHDTVAPCELRPKRPFQEANGVFSKEQGHASGVPIRLSRVRGAPPRFPTSTTTRQGVRCWSRALGRAPCCAHRRSKSRATPVPQ